jgi:hypothetical protein
VRRRHELAVADWQLCRRDVRRCQRVFSCSLALVLRRGQVRPFGLTFGAGSRTPKNGGIPRKSQRLNRQNAVLSMAYFLLPGSLDAGSYADIPD